MIHYSEWVSCHAFNRQNPPIQVVQCDATVGGVMLNVKTDFLSSRVQSVVVEDVMNGDLSVISCVSQVSVPGPILFLL